MRIVIIGAGPVGLMQAIILKQLGFNNITILEKRKEYTRKQILNIAAIYWYTLFPEKIRKKLEKKICYRNFITSDSIALCNTYKYNFSSFNDMFIGYNNPTMKIQDLERVLKETMKKSIFYISDLEINTKTKTVNNIPYDILIGADGSNSSVRKIIFKKKPRRLFKEYYSATFTFCCDKMTEYREFFQVDSTIHTFSTLQPRIRVFRTRSGLYTIAIALEKNEYKKIKGGELPFDFLEYLFKVFRFKGNPKDTLIEYNVFPIEIFEAETVYKKINGGEYYLVGDSAYSTHFFSGSGLNFGLVNAFLIARDLYFKKNEYQKIFDLFKGQRIFDLQISLLPSLKKLKTNCNQNNRLSLLPYFNQKEECYLNYFEENVNTNFITVDIEEYIIEIPFFYNKYKEYIQNLVKEQKRKFKIKGIPLSLKRFENVKMDKKKFRKEIISPLHKIIFDIIKNEHPLIIGTMLGFQELEKIVFLNFSLGLVTIKLSK